MSCLTWRYQQSLLWADSLRQESQSWFTGKLPLTLSVCYILLVKLEKRNFIKVDHKSHKTFVFKMQWRPRFCHSTYWKPNISSQTVWGIGTKNHRALQSLVRGAAGNSHIWRLQFMNFFNRTELDWFFYLQVGGWTQVYGNILSFATIRGASHEAPFSQPERSLVLFKAFLGGQPLPEAFWSGDHFITENTDSIVTCK